MCNLSQRIKEDRIAIGEARSEAKIILTMYKNGLTEEQVAALTNKDLKDVEDIIAGKAPIFAQRRIIILFFQEAFIGAYHIKIYQLYGALCKISHKPYLN